MLALLAALLLSPKLPEPPGAFAFFHYDLISHQETSQEWRKLTQFRLLLTNGYLTFSPERVTALHASGSRLFFYIWFSGFYAHEVEQPRPDGDWRREILEEHPNWLLNPREPCQGGGAVRPAYFYDLAQPDLRRFVSEAIAAHRTRTGYDGVFFDYAGSYAVPPAVLEAHHRLHPKLSYDQAGALFLHAVKARDPDILIMTNQAYRAAEELLPCTDIDIAESIATSFAWGEEVKILTQEEGWVETRETYYRPWGGDFGLRAMYREIVGKVRRFHPGLPVCTVDYVRAWWEPTGETVTQDDARFAVYRKRPDRAAVFYGYVAAKLFGLDSYSSDWYDRGCSEDDVFLADLGTPLGEEPEERDGVAFRLYEKGVVVLMTGEEQGILRLGAGSLPAGARGLWDLYDRRFLPLSEGGVTPILTATLSPVSGRRYPAARAYLYVW